MIVTHSPIAYTYEADHHCEDCTAARFGPDCEGIDREGNAVGAVFSGDEWFNAGEEGCDVLGCSDCGAILANAHDYECVHNAGETPCSLRPENIV